MGPLAVKIIDQNGRRVNNPELKNLILQARDMMCNAVNGEEGMIHKYWNPMLDSVGINDKDLRMETDDIAYTAVTNAIWTTCLRSLGVKNIKIVSEVFTTPTCMDIVLGLAGTVKIEVEVEQ